MAATPETTGESREKQPQRRKLPFHSLRGLTLTQEEADQLDPGLARGRGKGAARSTPDREAARTR